MTLSFFCPGIPVSGGSKRIFIVTSKLTGRPRPVVTEQVKGGKEWRAVVAMAAHQALNGRVSPWLNGGAVHLGLEFIMPRPRSLPKTKDVPMTRRPDALKLTRPIEDCLTGILWKDDSQIVRELISKRYGLVGESSGVQITIQSA